MKRRLRPILLLVLAALAGVVASEAIYRSPATRRLLARFFGIEQEMSPAGRNLRAASATEPVTDDEIDRELNLLRAQFGHEELFAKTLASLGLSLGAYRAEVAEHLCARSWIEKQIAPQLGASMQEDVRQFYGAHGAQFVQPLRYRALHLFLAAPEGSTPELIAAKQSAIQGLAVRMLAGEPLAQLAAEASEDEATKLRAGDLGYFAASRVPLEFFAEVEKLRPGQMSAPFRSHLGFHVLQLAEVKPPRTLPMDEAVREIALELENQKRATAVAQLNGQLEMDTAP